jgi:hypothetical protein
MDLDDLIISVFCLIDESLPRVTGGQRLRQRGPQPVLHDSEVLTMEVVGVYLGMTQDQALFAYFQRHWTHFFPALSHIHRTTFVRQAANLWAIKEHLWQLLLTLLPHDPQLAIVDCLPIPICQFARAYRCRCFAGEAAYGKDVVARQTFYGFRLHARLAWPGVITRFAVAPANVHDLTLLPALVEETSGFVVGDRNYWSPSLTTEFGHAGLALLAPYRWTTRDRTPARSALLSRVRYRIDTVFSQLVERCVLKRVWARDAWHLWNRLLRLVLMHTLVVLFNLQLNHPPLQLDRLMRSP